MVNTVRGLVRPIITLLVVGSAIAFVAVQLAVPEWFRDMAIMVTGFWFGSRADKPVTQ